MDLQLNQAQSSPSSSASEPNNHPPTHNASSSSSNNDPMHSWWESVSMARSRILSLSSLLPSSSSFLSSLAESDNPARSFLSSSAAYSALAESLSSSLAGSGSDPICHWLYDTFQSSDPELRLVVLSLLPVLSSVYMYRVFSVSVSDSPSLAGFEAVLLSIYASETKARAGKPVLVTIPDLSLPSLYHTPQNTPVHSAAAQSGPSIKVVSAPLEPQIAVKSTKRACILGVAFDCYHKQISQLPSCSKLEFCRVVAKWAGQHCPCTSEFDEFEVENDGNYVGTVGVSMGTDTGIVADDVDSAVLGMENLGIEDDKARSVSASVRIPLPWELFQPILRIIGHCLFAPLTLQDVKNAASVSVRCLYARAAHDLLPQAVLATRSLIQLDIRARAAARTAAETSSVNTPSKTRKPEILLVSK